MAKEKVQVVLAGGGTGGHIVPLLAVAEALAKKQITMAWIGDAGPMTKKLVTEAGIPLATIPTGKWRRYFSLENLLTPWRVHQGIRAAREHLKKYQPAVVLAKGGYASLPTVIAAHQQGIPIIIHESDAVMGWANRVASRYAAKICVSYPVEQYPEPLAKKAIETGVPIRQEFFTEKSESAHTKKRLLVMGSSQGARAINDALLAALPTLANYEIVHITGESDFERCKQATRPGYEPIGFVSSGMAKLMGQADLIISRSSSTLAEISLMGKPSILIPLPSAANDHQTANAAVWELMHAAIVLPEAKLSAERLTHTILDLFDHPDRLEAMGTAAKKLAHPDAVPAIVGVVQTFLSKE